MSIKAEQPALCLLKSVLCHPAAPRRTATTRHERARPCLALCLHIIR